MKSPHIYKFAFYALVGMMLVFGYCLCSAQYIPVDKQKHFYGGMVIGAWSTRLTIEQDTWKPVILGISVPTGLGLAKEGFDLLGGGTAEWADVGYTFAGAAASVIVIYSIKAIVKKRKRPRKK